MEATHLLNGFTVLFVPFRVSHCACRWGQMMSVLLAWEDGSGVCSLSALPSALQLHQSYTCVCVLYSALTLQVASELSVIARPLHGWSGESFLHAAALSSCREPAKSARRLGNQTSLPLSR